MKIGMKEKKDIFICCFCGNPIKPSQSDPVEIAINLSDGGAQGLQAHLACLREHLHESVPLAVGDANEE